MLRLLSLSLFFLLMHSAFADEKPPKAEPKKANRLAKETSPYLLQHAHNPVDWHPWGPEAFEKAKKEKKLVFLSIGYSSCHWCHVMEKESFAHEEVAKIMNAKFVCIKVDREERPDVDNIYMTALQALEQRGGWPLSMFLTPDGKPIVGGTYWPREDKEIEGKTYRGFKTILNAIADAWDKQRKEVEEQGERLAKATIAELEGIRAAPLLKIDRELVTDSVEAVIGNFDPEHGGFGPAGGTKFPMPARLIMLEEEIARSKSKEATKVVDLTLDRMARGGIYDQLGGGFHRYTTERTWLIPHFEKMLYDNAQLVEVYARAFQRTRSPVQRRVVEETLAFIEREMTSPDGAFYSALDADSEGEEGKFYIWTGLNIADVLPETADQKLIRNVYGADKANFEEKYRIFNLPKTLAEKAKELEMTEADLLKRLAPLKKKLFDVRAKRPRPFLDTKVLTAWNGQMIAGYAAAGEALGEKKYLDTAAKAANFILAKLRTKDGRLLRTYGAAPGQKPEAKLNAYLDDYAFLVHGLLCLHDATKEKKWLDEARALTETMIKHYHDEATGGFFYTSGDHEKLFARAKDQFDGAQPSGNSMAARNLVRLWIKTGEEKYKPLSEKAIRSMALPIKQNPTGVCTLASAIGMYLDAQKK